MGIVKKFNTIWLSLTYNCNNNCVWCYSASNREKRYEENLIEHHEKELTDFLYDLKVKRIILIGGEPTLYKGLPKLISDLSKRGIRVGIVSNGRKLENYSFCEELKENGLNSVSISIEGHDQQSHEAITQVKGSYEETIRGIRAVNKLGLIMSTNTVIGKNNINNLEKIVKSIIQEKIKVMTFNVCGVCLSNDGNNQNLLPLKEVVGAYKNIHDYIKSLGLKSRLVTPIPYCLFEEADRKKLLEEKVISGGPCQVVHGKNFAIEFNGNVLPCTHLAGYPLFNLFKGKNILKRKEFIREYNKKGGVAMELREKMSFYPSNKCNRENCNESCSGGCPLLWKGYDPNKEIPGIQNA